MSKLSFRARALDASKPMPIYLAEELPDLPDYSAINRAVPQMPSGMEKEEESEHHLQRAISGTGLIIPTPEVCEVTDLQFYERCYPPDYKMPKQHIHMQPSLVLGWGYRASDQRRWAVLHPACGGRQQSPIAISARQAIPISIPAMELIGYQNPLPGPLTITNNGHSVALTIPKYSSEEEKKGFRLPYIFGGPLDTEYEIEGLHFHWGDKNNRGSEHTLNDMRLPLEMHIIHRNKKYRNLAEALQHPDGLCVLAFFYQVVEFDAKLLTPIVKNLSAIENYNTSMQLPHTFSLSSILSGLDTERFYTYKGSLTTPPCAEAVTWVVFSDYLPISVFQMDNFRGLLSNLNLPLVDNFRQLQPLFGRRIFVRITSKNPKFKKTKLHYSKWDWVGHKKTENDVAEFDE